MSPTPPTIPPAERGPLARRPRFWLILAAALLAIIVAAIGVIALVADRSSDASPTPPPSTEPAATSDAATPSATEAPGTDATSPPTAVVIPASCDGIYTRDWAAELDGLLLNPAWTEAEPLWGSNDRGAVTMLEATSDLRCAWVTPSPGDVGIITDVASLTSEQQRSMIEYFGDAEFTCYEELSGTRCVIEERNDEGEWGESHFLRERIWVATRWTNASPDGYTHDIVATIFG